MLQKIFPFVCNIEEGSKLKAEEGNDGAAGGPDVSGGSAPGDSSLVSEQ